MDNQKPGLLHAFEVLESLKLSTAKADLVIIFLFKFSQKNKEKVITLDEGLEETQGTTLGDLEALEQGDTQSPNSRNNSKTNTNKQDKEVVNNNLNVNQKVETKENGNFKIEITKNSNQITNPVQQTNQVNRVDSTKNVITNGEDLIAQKVEITNIASSKIEQNKVKIDDSIESNPSSTNNYIKKSSDVSKNSQVTAETKNNINKIIPNMMNKISNINSVSSKKVTTVPLKTMTSKEINNQSGTNPGTTEKPSLLSKVSPKMNAINLKDIGTGGNKINVNYLSARETQGTNSGISKDIGKDINVVDKIKIANKLISSTKTSSTKKIETNIKPTTYNTNSKTDKK